MNKVERLKWVTNTFGADFVLPYHVCRDWQEIISAIKFFESRGQTWGMRTERISFGFGNGFGLSPFLHKGTKREACEIWRQHRGNLLYIVCRNILEYVCNGVAWPLCPEYIQFEFSRDRLKTQRAMMSSDERELDSLIVGPVRKRFLVFGGDDMFLHGKQVICQPYPVDFASVPKGPVFHISDPRIRDLRFDIVYRLFKENSEVDEITFSVRLSDRKVVIW